MKSKRSPTLKKKSRKKSTFPKLLYNNLKSHQKKLEATIPKKPNRAKNLPKPIQRVYPSWFTIFSSVHKFSIFFVIFFWLLCECACVCVCRSSGNKYPLQLSVSTLNINITLSPFFSFFPFSGVNGPISVDYSRWVIGKNESFMRDFE